MKIFENKKELFSFVSKQLAKTDMDGILLISTESKKVLSNKPFDVSALQPCNHAEADTRIILHVAHASSQGHDKVCVRTVDSDIVVLTIAFYKSLAFQSFGLASAVGKTTEISRSTASTHSSFPQNH